MPYEHMWFILESYYKILHKACKKMEEECSYKVIQNSTRIIVRIVKVSVIGWGRESTPELNCIDHNKTMKSGRKTL